MSSVLTVHIANRGNSSFHDMLDEANISYAIRPPQPGVVMNAGESIQIAADALPHAAWATALATVLCTWIKSRTTRKAIFTTKAHEVVHHFEGMTPDEIEKLLTVSQSLMIIDTKPEPEHKDG